MEAIKHEARELAALTPVIDASQITPGTSKSRLCRSSKLAQEPPLDRRQESLT
jgi:hypothetical protein